MIISNYERLKYRSISIL